VVADIFVQDYGDRERIINWLRGFYTSEKGSLLTTRERVSVGIEYLIANGCIETGDLVYLNDHDAYRNWSITEFGQLVYECVETIESIRKT